MTRKALLALVALLLLLATCAPSAVRAQGSSSAASASASASASNSASASASATATATASQSLSASRTVSQTATATATQTQDPCASGRCTPPGKTKECIVISRVWMYREFNKQAYLPVDLSPYFRARFDNFDESIFPKSMKNASDIPELWGNQPWAYFGKYWEQFHVKQAGCAYPSQKFYLVWGLLDMYKFFQDAGDHCAQGPPLEVCADTLDQRAQTMAADLKNKTLCAGPPEYIDAGTKFIDTLKTHPFRSANPGCVDGLQVEEDAGKCGYWLQFAACANANTCPTLDKSFAGECPKIIESFRTAYNPAQTADSGVSGDGKQSSSAKVIVPAVIGGVIAVAVVGGLMALKMTRRKSGPGIMATLGRMTLGRPTADAAAAVPLNSTAPPGDDASKAAATPPAFTAGSVAASTVPAPEPAYILAGGPDLSATAPLLFDPANPRASIATHSMHSLVTTDAAGNAVMYVDQYGQPVAVAPAGVYAASSAGGSLHGGSPLVMATPGPAIVDSTTTTTTTSNMQSAVQQHTSNETYVTTTTTTEQFVMYVDENGNPCDEQGNPLPMSDPQVAAFVAQQQQQQQGQQTPRQ